MEVPSEPFLKNNFWVGYSTRTFSEHINSMRVMWLVFEHLGQKRSEIMAMARQAGFCDLDELWPYHCRLLPPHRGLFVTVSQAVCRSR